MPLRMPLMPDCFLHWTEPADANGDEVFRLVSWRRSLTLKGKAFRAFEAEVPPLLKGKLSIDEIAAKVAHVFRKEDLIASLDLLASQGIVIEGDSDMVQQSQERRAPQLGWLSEATGDADLAQRRLDDAHIVIFGAGLHGAVTARALVAAGVGRLTIIDPADVTQADTYFSGLFDDDDIGDNRADALVTALSRDDVRTILTSHAERPVDAAACSSIIKDASLVLCCLDTGELTLIHAVNIACRAGRVRWIAASLEGGDLIVGPGFDPAADNPCYMCWRQREVAAASNPHARYALEMQLERTHADLSARRENLAPSADIVGGMLSAEALTWLTGVGPANLTGRFLLIEAPGLRMEKHRVLRKPGCPICGGAGTHP